MLLSNADHLFDELVLKTSATLKVNMDPSFPIDFDFYVVARNNYFNRRIQLTKNDRFQSLFELDLKNFFQLNELGYMFFGVLLGLSVVLVYHLVIKKLQFIKFLNSKQRNLDDQQKEK
jgi:hypothetical protein